MPFVIAIESDRQQAAQLTQVVRQRVGAELVLATSLDEALDALRSRVPDVMLIPPLLTPKEDAALTEALREVAGPVPVPTLIIPTLAVTRRSFVSGGGWPWSRKEKSEEDGCDPAVFAEQLTTYLSQSAERSVSDRTLAQTPATSPEYVVERVAVLEPEPENEPEASLIADPDDDAPPFEFSTRESQFESIDARLAEIEHAPRIEPFESGPAMWDEPAVVHDDRHTISERPAVEEQILLPPIPSSDATRPRNREDREWERLIASLREAVEGLTVEAWLTRSTLPNEPARAARDEWGIHDPAQCAMPAVMRRLEELEATRAGSRGAAR